MSFQKTKVISRCLKLVLAAMSLWGVADIASANDGPIEFLLESTGVDLQKSESYLAALSNPADLKLNRRRYVSPNGTEMTLLGSHSGNASEIDKLTVNYANAKDRFEKSVAGLKALLGEPVSGRRDLLVWETTNSQRAGSTQGEKITIVAGMHGTDKYVISVDRRGKSRGNNKNRLKLEKRKLKIQQNKAPKTRKTNRSSAEF